MRWLIQAVRRLILTGGAFLLFFSVGSLLSYVVLPLASLRGTRAEAARRCRRIVARTWVLFHGYMRVCGLVHFDPRRVRLELPPGGAVVVANHPTLVDVTALVSTCPELVFVVKKEMFRSPLVGPLLRRCDHIESGTGPLAGAAVIEDAVDRLRAGASVLIFPEGTRSPQLTIGPFRPGAFEIAARARVPIVPVFMCCWPPGLMRGQRWYDIPETTMQLVVKQLPPIEPPTGRPARSREALRELYVRMLDAHLETTRTNPGQLDAPGHQEATWRTLNPS